jgi:hypothetical protein
VAGESTKRIIALRCDADDAGDTDRALACFTVSQNDSPPNVTAENDLGPALAAASKVDVALAEALSHAAAAGRFDIVAQLAHELEARRLARSNSVERSDHRDHGKR